MTIRYEAFDDHAVMITLDRPQQLNTFDKALRADLLDAVCRASNDASVRAVVLTGAGRAFCAGADIKSIDPDRNVEDVLNAEYGGFLNVIRTCEKPVISAINGPAAGIGMTLALSCDLRVMAEGAYLMSAFANIGLVPDGGLSWILTQAVGYPRAYEYAVEAKKISASEALAFGLVNRMVGPDVLLADAQAWAVELSRRAPLALAATKRAFRAACEEGLRNAMAYEAMTQRSLIRTEDCLEGVAAVLQKRPAAFKGR